MTVTLITPPSGPGPLTAVVNNGISSGAPVQVASIVPLPTVTLTSTSLPINATTVTITGTGFDSSSPGNNTVTLNDGATGTVTSATATSLIVTFGTNPTAVGSLTAVVTSFGGSSGTATQIATVAPVVTSSTASLAANATTVTINGFGFDSATPSNNTVTFNDSATGTVTSATSTTLTVTFGTKPASVGSLTAVVTTDAVSSGAAVQVATVIPVITPSSANLAANAGSISISGFGFDLNNLKDGVTFSGAGTGAGTVTAASSTGLGVNLPAGLIAGVLNATMTSNSVSSGAAVQVATITPVVTSSTASLAANATTVTINGAGFDPTAAHNSVVLNDGSTGTVTSATNTQLTVTFGTKPTSAGTLTAIVTTNSVSSGSAVQVATVIPVVTSSTASIQTTGATVTINGFGFDSSNANNSVTLNLGATVSSITSTPTQIVVTFGTKPTVGNLNAVVTSNGQSSGSAVQVATVVNIGITPNTLPNWTVNMSGYSQTLTGTGGTSPYTFSVTAGSLPTGLSLASGVISGTPTAAGTFNFTVTTTDNLSASGSQSYSIVINSAVAVSPSTLPNWTVNATGYTQTVTSSGGTGAKTLSISSGAIPTGMTFTAGTGALSGTPTAAGTFNFTVTATDTAGATGAQAYSVVINSAISYGALSVTTWTVNQVGYSGTVAVSGGTGAYSGLNVTGLPTGLSAAIVGSTITISGTPTAAASTPNNVSIMLSDSVGASTTQTFTLTVNTLTITSSTASLAQNATQLIINGTGFSTTLANNSISLSSGTATVTAATATQLTCSLVGPLTLGTLNATATVVGNGSTSATQVATVVAAPTVTLATTSNAINATTVTITGTGFDSSSPGNNTVTLNDGATGTVTSATATSLTVTFGTKPTAVGSLTVVVTSFGGSSGTAKQIATVTPVVTSSSSNLSVDANTLLINGVGFDTTAANNTVSFSNGATGTVTSATGAQLTVTFGTHATSLGSMTASVTTDTVSSGSAVQVATVIAGAATHFSVTAPGTATAGVAISTTVTALDQFNNTAISYTGIVHFTTTDVNGSALVPTNYSFLAGDNGVHAFSGGVTLVTAGSKTVTATDTVTGSIIGTSGNIVVSAAAATHLAVSAPGTATAGVAINSAVTALDQFNNTATSYTGTVHFTTSDSGAGAAVPGNYTFLAGDSGVHTFASVVTLVTAGTQTVTATDMVTGTINGTTANIVVGSAAASQLVVSAPGTATAGVAINTTVTAKDAFGNTATGYLGTVHFTKTDSGSGSAVPANYAFVAGDNGVHTFTNGVTLVTAGNRTVTATDTVTGSITGTSGTISVNAAAATQLIVSAPGTATAGTAVSVSVTAQDAFGNTATAYTGTVHFTSTDASSVLPANNTLTAGAGNFNVTFKTAGNQTVTATDTVTGSITGTSGTIAVSAAAASQLAVSAVGTATAGVAINSSVTALDAFGNTAISYTGTVKFAASDSGGSVVLPTNYTFLPGDNGVHVFFSALTFVTAGTQTLTATDTISGSINGTSSGTLVSAAAANHLAVTAPGTATAGVAINTTVTAQDQYGNTAISYLGTVNFTKTDAGTGSAVPVNYTFVVGDSGVHTFASVVTLVSAGSQSVTATDTVTGSITGTSGSILVNPAATSHFVVTAPATAGPGTPITVTLTAEDAFNNLTPAYTGTVAFTLSDTAGGTAVPSNYTFLAGDAGVHTFTSGVTFATPGVQTVTGTDTVSASITGLATVNVGTLNPTPIQLVPTDPVTGLPLPAGSLYPVISQTGTLEVRVSIKNTTAFPINGFRLSVDYSAYLPFHSLVLYNRTSPSNYSEPAHIDYIDYPYPVAVNASVSLKLEFYTTTRSLPNPFSPTLKVTTLPTSEVSSTDSSGVQPRIRMLPPNNNVLLEWDSTLGQWYRIKYSSDLVNWYDCPVPVQGVANRTQWVDDGPPFTNVPPSSVGARYYKLNAISAPTGP